MLQREGVLAAVAAEVERLALVLERGRARHDRDRHPAHRIDRGRRRLLRRAPHCDDLRQDRERDLLRRARADVEPGRRVDAVEQLGCATPSPRSSPSTPWPRRRLATSPTYGSACLERRPSARAAPRGRDRRRPARGRPRAARSRRRRRRPCRARTRRRAAAARARSACRPRPARAARAPPAPRTPRSSPQTGTGSARSRRRAPPRRRTAPPAAASSRRSRSRAARTRARSARRSRRPRSPRSSRPRARARCCRASRSSGARPAPRSRSRTERRVPQAPARAG